MDAYLSTRPLRRAMCLAAVGALLLIPGTAGRTQEPPPSEPAKVEAAPPKESAPAADTAKPAQDEKKAPPAANAAEKRTPKASSTKPSKPAKSNSAPKRIPGSLPVADAAKTFTMNFRGADIDRILDFYGMISGLAVIKDPSLTGTATILAAKPVTLDQAFDILNAYLDTRGYVATRENGMLRVRLKGSDTGSGGQGGASSPFQSLISSMTPTQPETRVFPIKYASAQSVSRIINELFRDGGGMAGPQQAQQRMQQVMAQLAQFRGRGGGPGMDPNRVRDLMTRFAPMMAAQNSVGTARASYDDYSNSVVVTGTPQLMEQIQSIIEELDQEVPSNLKTQVFTLKYVDCQQMANVISSLLIATANGGANSGALRNVPFEQRVFAAARAGTAGAVSGQVVPYPETNSVVVTASPDTLKMLTSVVEQLDVKQQLQSTTFVYPLAKASATEVANILVSMFGQRSGSYNRAYGTTFGTGTQQVRRRLDQQGGNRSGFGTGFGGSNTPRGGTYRGGSLNMPQGANAGPAAFNAASAMQQDPYTLESVPYSASEAAQAPQDPEAPNDNMLAQFGGPGFGFGGGGQRFGFGGSTGSSSTSGVSSSARTGRGFGGEVGVLADLLGSLIVVPDTNSNSLVISTDPANMEILQQVLSRLDVVPQQVMIQAIIAEATLDNSTKLGFNFQFTNSGVAGSGTAGSGTINVQPSSISGGATYSLVGASFEAVLNAIQSDSRFKVLSTPRIFTANNRQAQINISQQIPYVTGTTIYSTGTQTTTFAYMDVGIILDVTPHISQNGYVTIEVDQEASDFQGFTNFNAPIVAQRSTQTTVSVMDGQTVVIGGLIKDSETTSVNKVPILGSLPIIGSLFRSKDKSKNRTELMVFLTPHVVNNAAEANALTADEKSKLRDGDKIKIAPPAKEPEPPRFFPPPPQQESPGGGAVEPREQPQQPAAPAPQATPQRHDGGDGTAPQSQVS